jgi:IgGFc binding protein/CHU_C Type IX secretion signal domain/SprB repeat
MARLALFFCFFSIATDLQSQLDTIHYLPCMHARGEQGPQYLYLSTPEAQPFEVTIEDGAGNIVSTEIINNTSPYVLPLGSSHFTKVMVSQDSLHKPITGKGLVIHGEKPFYAYFRVHSDSRFQAGDLTCKGRAALGTTFRIGHLLQGHYGQSMRSNFFSVMATEDSTLVNVSEYENNTRFRMNSTNAPYAPNQQVTLNKGQTVTFSQYAAPTAGENPVNGFMGTLLTCSKPCAVNTGSWTGSPVTYSANDIGIDQIVPFELVGDEYILCRGNGSEVLERPILVAHKNDTKVYINGATTPQHTLQAGDWVALQTSLYTQQGNMHILTSEPLYVYQMVGGVATGDDVPRTAGLIFVPPVSCGIPNKVDPIFLPNQIGSMRFDGGMMITAMRDSSVVVRVDGVPVPIGAAGTVVGNPDFVTYRALTMFQQSGSPQTVSVVAEGAVQVALFGRNEPASFAGFFSGFTMIQRPKLTLNLIGDGVCPDTLVASGRFDGVQWMFGDSLIQFGPDSVLIAYAPGQYIARGYLGVCRRNNFASDTTEAVFQSPEFPFTFEEPTCFGFTNGSIKFGQPTGGIAPYTYSVDKGLTFTTDSVVTGLGAAEYALVVRDSTGCYNRPELVTIGQPDSVGVQLIATQLPDPLYPGDMANFQAIPERPITQAQWIPERNPACTDCLNYTWVADVSRWIEVTVTDTMGCPATARLYVEVTPNVYAPNVFAPASSADNQVFTLLSEIALPIHLMRIYDRWGELVFERRDITTNNPAMGWDGRNPRRQALNPGVFVWTAEVELRTGKVTRLQGEVTLVR